MGKGQGSSLPCLGISALDISFIAFHSEMVLVFCLYSVVIGKVVHHLILVEDVLSEQINLHGHFKVRVLVLVHFSDLKDQFFIGRLED